MIKVAGLFLVLLGLFSNVMSQSAIVPVGGDIGGNQVSYTVGQIDYSNKSGSGSSLNEGVQQPYEFYIVGEKENDKISIEMSVFPNPTQSEIFLVIEDLNPEKLMLQLFDSNGKQVLESKVSSEKTRINIQEEPVGTYILSVFDERSVLQTFKIIKNR